MNILKVNYNTETYVATDINRGLTEKDVMHYYSELGYNVIKNYVSYIKGQKTTPTIKKILQGIKVSQNIIDLFNKYASGYPDILLVNGKNIKFVEIKLNNDRLRESQIIFLEELGKIANVSLCYFINVDLITREDYTNISKYTPEQKVILNQIELYTTLSKKQGHKDFWVVAQLYKKFGNLILQKKILGLIADNINQPKDKIMWFINEHLRSHKYITPSEVPKPKATKSAKKPIKKKNIGYKIPRGKLKTARKLY
jgi:hypothetical protein